jgi:tetratricopeptide (TPR) repeat protein
LEVPVTTILKRCTPLLILLAFMTGYAFAHEPSSPAPVPMSPKEITEQSQGSIQASAKVKRDVTVVPITRGKSPLLSRIQGLKPEKRLFLTEPEPRIEEIRPAAEPVTTKSTKKKGKKAVQVAEAQPDPFLEVVILFQEALDLGDAKEYPAAIEKYSACLKILPKDANIFFDRGLAYQYSGQYSKAIADYSRAIELDPQMDDAFYNRAVAHHQLGEFGPAIQDYSKAIELDDDEAVFYWNRGVAFSDLGEYREATSDYCKAMDIDASVTSAKPAESGQIH